MGLYDVDSDAMLSRLARLEDSIPLLIGGNGYAGNRFATQSSISNTAVSNGMLDLSATGILVPGSISPTVNTAGFAATATTTSITWYWDGTNSSVVIVIKRSDGTSVTIGGNPLTVNNLTANTWYGFLPYWVPSNACGIGWVQGDTGTPQIAFAGGTGASFVPTASVSTLLSASANQILQGREQLSQSFMTYRTPAAGTSSGGASGGGSASDGACVMNGTDIETLGGLDYSSEIHKQTDWRRLLVPSGKSINCTPDHNLYHADRGRVEADTFKIGDWIITKIGEQKIAESQRFRRLCTKVKVKMPTGHLFWANDFLSHNVKASYQ